MLYLFKAVLPIPTFVVDFTNHLGNLCLPISLLIIGALLATQDMKKMLSSWRLYFFNFIKLLIVPLFICLLTKLVTLGMEDSHSIILFCTVIAAMPSATTVAMLSEMYDLDSPYAAQVVGTTSLFSLATLPLMFFIADLVARI